LTKEQYDAVRTPEFKQWFGDWENDPENASKFVDDNGEPQVFYHGTYNEFDRFSTDPDKKRYSIHKKGIFFTPTLTGAKAYGDIQMPVFLDAKTFDYNEADFNNSFEAERKKENEVLENTDKEGVVTAFREKPQVQDWINIGYFIFENEIFNFLEADSILEEGPLHELSRLGQLGQYKHEGFWQPMDTYRESQILNQMWSAGAPWKTW
jgi:hypothetical protein